MCFNCIIKPILCSFLFIFWAILSFIIIFITRCVVAMYAYVSANDGDFDVVNIFESDEFNDWGNAEYWYWGLIICAIFWFILFMFFCLFFFFCETSKICLKFSAKSTVIYCCFNSNPDMLNNENILFYFFYNVFCCYCCYESTEDRIYKDQCEQNLKTFCTKDLYPEEYI